MHRLNVCIAYSLQIAQLFIHVFLHCNHTWLCKDTDMELGDCQYTVVFFFLSLLNNNQIQNNYIILSKMLTVYVESPSAFSEFI